MKRPLETARRWLAQAEHSLSVTRVLLDNGLWPEVCFHAEGTAKLALKAYLFFEGRRFVNVNSVRTPAEECINHDAGFRRRNRGSSPLQDTFRPDDDLIGDFMLFVERWRARRSPAHLTNNPEGL